MAVKIYFDCPQNFVPRVEVAGCFLEWKDKFLYLKRNSDKPQGDTWGIPAGKVEKGEDPYQATFS